MAYDKAYFDKWYRSRRHRVRTKAQIRRLVSFTVGAAEYVLDRPIRSVLDVGAGEGHWQPLLAELRPRVRYIGVEPSEYAVARFGARRNLRRGSIESLESLGLHAEFPDGFDLVVCCGVLNYVPTRLLAAAITQVQQHTSGVAWLELFSANDSIEGDVAQLRPKSAKWYRARFEAAGFLSCGLHLYAPTDQAANLSALEHAG